MKDYNPFNKNRLREAVQEFIPELIRRNSNDYAMFMLTIAFKDTPYTVHRSDDCDPYLEYFKSYYMKLRQRIVNGKIKSSTLKPFFAVIPENSRQRNHQHCKEDLYTPDHYHGVLGIPKNAMDRFERKCVESKERVPHDLVGYVTEYYLKPFKRRRSTLQMIPYDIHAVAITDSSAGCVGGYSMKSFNRTTKIKKGKFGVIHQKITFDDVLLFH